MAEVLGTMTFGRHKGDDVEDVPSDYLRFLLTKEWFEEQHNALFVGVQVEMKYRDRFDVHF